MRRELYLDTVRRDRLEFGFEKVCSVSLAHTNVYMCLVCGKYFQGRGPKSHAYFHAIDEGHHVFMHMDSARVFVLPDNYEVHDPSLADIQYQLQLTYGDKELAAIEEPARDLHAKTYLPGFLGLNNTGHHDAMNAVVQALAHVTPLRDFFLRRDELATPLVSQFGMLIRRLWNPRAFKTHVSPHEFLHAVSEASHGRFSLTQSCDPVDFLGWLLNHLHMDLAGKGARKKPSIITECFRGALRLETRKVTARTGLEEEAAGQAEPELAPRIGPPETAQVPFLLLAMDLPPLPVFQDAVADIIPQVPLAHLLAKYDGTTTQDTPGAIRRHKLTQLPPYLIIHFRRFTHNRFVAERNTTIVNFPPVGLNMREYVDAPGARLGTVYHLVANITHDAVAGTVREHSVWRAQVRANTKPPQWFQVQDVLVEPVDQQMLFLGESYIQIWARQAPTT